MSGDADDAALQAHIKDFLTALGEGPDDLMRKHLATIEQPNPGQAADFRRYINDLKRAYGAGLLSMYKRIESHGRAICELSAETEITEPVRQIMTLVALDGQDVPRVLASFDNAAEQLNAGALVRLFMTIGGAGAGGLPRQAQRDALVLDFTAYCLTRFEPPEIE
jgi:hypothetical protein